MVRTSSEALGYLLVLGLSTSEHIVPSFGQGEYNLRNLNGDSRSQGFVNVPDPPRG